MYFENQNYEILDRAFYANALRNLKNIKQTRHENLEKKEHSL